MDLFQNIRRSRRICRRCMAAAVCTVVALCFQDWRLKIRKIFEHLQIVALPWPSLDSTPTSSKATPCVEMISLGTEGNQLKASFGSLSITWKFNIVDKKEPSNGQVVRKAFCDKAFSHAARPLSPWSESRIWKKSRSNIGPLGLE